tara:strand:+ start:966 stop:1277 length:312 start_codon:yes stop_codon:yes gene_type:complete
MQSISLKIYVAEQQLHNGKLLYEWLLEEAKRLGVPGGSAFRAIEGFGRHACMHRETFFELAGELPVQVEFIMDSKQAESLFEVLHQHKLNLFYARSTVETGIL